ncbi:MAG: conjugal transfer protein TraB [Desulfobacteraceae bacterium 4572_130]|nr:MAG: conjugal transfer protein TraB [Desulfobacteraceae bacterium 4572_130]
MKNFKENKMVHDISCNGKNIILIGTAHVSKQSAKLVKDIINKEKPDTVCVELCKTRLDSIENNDKWRNMDIVKIIKEKKALLLLMNLMLASFQKKIAEKFDVKPGQEMINAVNSAREMNSRIIPCDRNIQITLSRIWRSLVIWEKTKLLFQLLASIISSNEITEKEIEEMKQEDILKTLLSDVKKSHPIMKKVLIDERDQYLAEKIKNSPGHKIVAVVGAGHVPGIKKHIKDDLKTDINRLNAIPPRGNISKILKWLIPGAILFLLLAGFTIKGKNAGTDMIWLWIAANGIFAGLGAILAFAHPLTIISSILAAPLTSLNPMIAAGWISGLVEVFSRKPKIKDIESIPYDILSIKGFWKNNITRVLLVVVFTNLGSTIGTLTAIPLMIKIIN